MVTQVTTCVSTQYGNFTTKPLACFGPRIPFWSPAEAGWRAFFPLQKSSLPVELKHELFAMLTPEIARQIKRRGISEREVLADFENWRKGRRESRRRR
jgi:hypothetical protein